ncbi:hypothetical protein VTP01DRAFT_6832 [Rhizomucor pusillus]|uniref:uncharacterized protein n=1 Tax=Rhizomucor pusillus TaxID=4840 RepID=UPI0037438B9D
MTSLPCLDRGKSYTFAHQLCFLLTGVGTTLAVQWIFYKGAATADSNLTQLAQYVGTVLVGAFIPLILSSKKKSASYTSVATNESTEDLTADRISMEDLGKGDAEQPVQQKEVSDGPVQHKSVFRLSVLDVLANFCVTMGFFAIGSGMYQVIYSSIVIWCAILTYFFMGRTMTKLQWVAIFGSSAGLALSSFGNFGLEEDDGDKKHAAVLMLGTILTICGTFFYACLYVYSDHILSRQVPPPLPARVCFMSGLYSTALSLIWVAVYTLPRFDQLIHVHDEVSNAEVLSMYAFVTVSNALHSWNYYELIERTGNVATGILQGLRAILVYILSHAWFCTTDSAQCFTVYKGFGSILVISCVLLFVVGGQPAKK